MNFDTDLTEAERDAIINRRAALVAGTATQGQKDNLLKDVLRLLIDAPS